MRITAPYGYDEIVPLRKQHRVLVPSGGATAMRLAGMYRVDEARLKDLKPASHKVLVGKDFMGRIYAHVHSLENFSRLYARAVARKR